MQLEQNLYTNDMLKHALDSFNALSSITPNTYCSDYAAQLANTLERFYKGFILYAEQNIPTMTIPYYTNSFGENVSLIDHSHNLIRLKTYLHKQFPGYFHLRDSLEQQKQYKNLARLTHIYTDSRYTEFVPYKEFSKLRRMVADEKQYLDFMMNKIIPKIVEKEENFLRSFD